uniref:uncharacterized protein LOC120336206 n=1 Tax=Styela clava TaxID=7725 RepID=UPI00193A46EE|nr:uncharacterized protein LOC120336206 [Styela clava]
MMGNWALIILLYISVIVVTVSCLDESKQAVTLEKGSRTNTTTINSPSSKDRALKQQKKERRRRYPLRVAYRMTRDDLLSFWQSINNDILKCDVDEYYSFPLHTCEPCQKICDSSEGDMKKCQLFCPDDFVKTSLWNWFILSICVVSVGVISNVLLIFVVLVNFYKKGCRNGNLSSQEFESGSKMSCSEEIGKSLQTYKTPDLLPGGSVSSSASNTMEKNYLQTAQYSPTQDKGNGEMAIENEHPVPEELRQKQTNNPSHRRK